MNPPVKNTEPAAQQPADDDEVDSHTTKKDKDTAGQTTKQPPPADNQDPGAITTEPIPDDPPASGSRARETRRDATNRGTREGIRGETDAFRDRVRKECLDRGLPRHEASGHAWEAALVAFPLEGQPVDSVPMPEAPSTPARGDGDAGRVQGLGDIPSAWPELPDNASLQAEIAWVQAQRLRIVEERVSGATHVHLERARSPAPSYAAIGWLETSIRSYAKYVEVAAKCSATQVDEQQSVRRERMKIEEIRELLDEMHQDDPHTP